MLQNKPKKIFIYRQLMFIPYPEEEKNIHFIIKPQINTSESYFLSFWFTLSKIPNLYLSPSVSVP